MPHIYHINKIVELPYESKTYQPSTRPLEMHTLIEGAVRECWSEVNHNRGTTMGTAFPPLMSASRNLEVHLPISLKRGI
jgi:hypothetical protein